MNKADRIRDELKKKFELVKFQEDIHAYFLEGFRLISVSKVIENFTEKQDFNKLAVLVANKKGIPVEEVRKEWKDENTKSIVKGHKVHKSGEGEVEDIVPELPEQVALKDFWRDFIGTRYVVVAKELVMYHHNNLYAGTCDLVLLDTHTDSLVLVDYKTNKDIFKNYKGKELVGIFKGLLDMPYNKYQIQLSLYQILLEQIGMAVTQRWVVWLKSDGSYSKLDAYDFTPQVRGWLEGKKFAISN